jgi:hypothetical protein
MPIRYGLIDKGGTIRYINPKFKDEFRYDLADIPFRREWFLEGLPDPDS